MSALAEEGLREIDELSSSSGNSLKVSIEELGNERLRTDPQSDDPQERIRARVTDTEARMLALYQLAALKAKKADNIAQIQKIWKGPLLVYEIGFKMISVLTSKGEKDPYILHLFETISKLRSQVRWLSELHGDE